MLKTYIVSYDLIRQESRLEYIKLIGAIKSAQIWAKPLESLWLIKTTLSSMQIAQEIKKVVGNNDKFIVIEVGSDWTSFNIDDKVVSWLRVNVS